MPQIRVLVVDDDPMVQQVNREYVESVPGFRVVALAKNGKEALEATAAHRPDLVLLDIYLPDQNGVSVLKEIRRRQLPSDVLMVSAAQDTKTLQEIMRYGAVDYVIKPFRLQRLQEALKKYRATRSRLSNAGALDQDQVDQVLRGGQPGQADGALPKGLNEVTLRQVQALLAEHGQALSAAEVAHKMGIARVTARRYLDCLVKQKQVRLEVQYGSVGRPINRYRAI